MSYENLNELLKGGALSEYDFGVMEHGFLPHGRDYRFLIQDSLCRDPGTYELIFTHIVDFRYETRVGDTTWQHSWADEYTDYARWTQAGSPDGYVFGTEWSLAYPGLSVSPPSPEAVRWSQRLQRSMSSVTLETDRFSIALIFHSVQHKKLSIAMGAVKQVLIPLQASVKDQSS